LQRAAAGEGSRLITLVGPGGVGKTRLALQLAAAMHEAMADGVAFCDLSALRSDDLVPATVAHTLGVHETGAQSVAAQLQATLRERQMLLVLDNFEQVAEAAAWVADLVAGCPQLVVLITSRMPLRVRAEQRYRVPPLATPGAATELPFEAVAGFAAVRLFVARARAVRSDFSLTAENCQAVAQICRMVDGLPLAIELAAARTPLLPPAALLARLERRLALLRGGPRDLPDRQQTLRATIDWSVALLSEAEQTLFRRLGVFVAGCTLEAVDATCNPDGVLDVLEGLASLVDKSLVQQIEADGEPRFGMLETVHEYAREQLVAQGEWVPLRRSHALHYLDRAETNQINTAGPDQKRWLDQWARDHDNARAALQWALESGEAAIGLRLGSILWRFWYRHGDLSEGREWLERLLQQPGAVAPEVRARALRGAGSLAVQQGDLARGIALCEECLALFRELDDRAGIADNLIALGNAARNQGDYERAVACYQESLAYFRAAGDALGVSVVLNNLGMTAQHQGDLATAEALYTESLQRRRALGDVWGIAFLLNNLGDVARYRGDLDRATALCEESLALRRDLGDKQGIGGSLGVLAAVARAQGQMEQAAAYYREILEHGRATGDAALLAVALEGLAAVALDRGQAAEAARLLGAESALRLSTHTLRKPIERMHYTLLVTEVRSALGEAPFHAAWDSGERQQVDQIYGELLGIA
jgi:predicted ATPase